MNKNSLLLFLLLFTITLQSQQVTAESRECIIVLHGMGRTHFSMNKIEKALNEAGYVVWNETYPSTKQRIEESSIKHINKGVGYCNEKNTSAINFVTHSLGGIMARYYLQDHAINNLGKIIMLSPPNKGSEVANHFKDTVLYQWVTGPAGQQLGTEEGSLPNRLKQIDAVFGIITGESSSDPWFSPIIPGKDDGKVSVDSAKLDEMSDFLVVDSGHAFIMRNSVVIDQIKHFLINGKFKR